MRAGHERMYINPIPVLKSSPPPLSRKASLTVRFTSREAQNRKGARSGKPSPPTPLMALRPKLLLCQRPLEYISVQRVYSLAMLAKLLHKCMTVQLATEIGTGG